MTHVGDAPEVTVVNAVRSEPPAVPAGPLYLCASLERRGIRVRFEDYQAYEGPGLGDPDEFAEWLEDAAPVVGFSVFTSSLPLVLAAARRLKARRPARRLVVGGPGTAGIEAVLLQRFPDIDIVVHGEGEETLADIVGALRAGRPLDPVPGLSHRDARGVHTTTARPRIAALDELPPPAYHLASLAPYRQERWRDRTPFGVMLSRGCAFDCTFCAIPNAWHREVHARPVTAVVDELRVLAERFGIDSFRILDDTFTLDRQRVLRFCDQLTAAGLDLPWLCHARVDLVDEPLVAAMREAGCRLVFYGLESGSDRVLRRLGKTFDVARALDVVECSRRYVDVETSFMWGFPFETIEDLYDTVVAVLAVHEMGARPKLSWFVPLPATALMREFGGMLGRTLRHEVFPARSHMDAYAYGPELLAIVGAHPDLFPSFYYLDYPGHGEKMAYLARWAPKEPGATSPDAIEDFRDVSGRGVATLLDARDPEGGRPLGRSLPQPATGVSLRRVGGRRFLFDAENLRAFRLSPFAEEVFGGCLKRAVSDGLVADLVARHIRGYGEVRAAVERVLGRLEAEGLLASARPCSDAENRGEDLPQEVSFAPP